MSGLACPQVRDKLAPYIEEANTDRAEEPLMPATRQEVHVGTLYVDDTRTDTLDAIDVQVDPTPAAEGAKPIQVRTVAVRELDEADGDEPRPLIRSRDDVVDQDSSLASGDHFRLHPEAVAQVPPRID